MATELAGIIYALASGLTWGVGDFSGGVASRRTPVIVVIVLSQFIGILCLLSVIILFSEPLPPWPDLLFGAFAGMAGAMGLTAFYRGLASRPMGMVAPVSAAMSAMLPVLFSVVFMGLPAIPQWLGLTLAILAIWTIAQDKTSFSMQWRQLGLPAISGVGFAGFFIFMDQVGEGVVFWPIVAARSMAVLILVCIIIGNRRWQLPPSRQFPIIILTGVFDTAGNTLFALAANTVRLDIAAVLASFYPATTVLLARLFLHERLSRKQWVGVIAALVAVMLMAW
jgi:drug/metabolite transporter (DMT)-like permease